jgi:hypothetical protein
VLTDVVRDVGISFAPVVRRVGVDEHHPRHVVRMTSGVQREIGPPKDQATSVRRVDLLRGQQLLEVGDALVAGMEADLVAPAVVRAVVRAHAREVRHPVDHVVPGRGVGRESRFEDDRRASLTAAVHVEAAPTDVDLQARRADASGRRADDDEGEVEERLQHQSPSPRVSPD